MSLNLIIPAVKAFMLPRAKLFQVTVNKDSTLEIANLKQEGYDYKLIQMSKDVVILAENCGGELIFTDALEIMNYGALDAITKEALREHRARTDQLLTMLHPLMGRAPLNVPNGAHAIFWAYLI